MIVKSNPKRMIIGLWVLAALLILWYNAAAMTSLLDQPLAGLSPQAKAAITKWQRLEMQITSQLKETLHIQELEKYLTAIDMEKVKAILPKKDTKPKPAAKKEALPVKKEEVILPKVNGIVEIHNAAGESVFRAIIDGKTREVKSRIGDFLLVRIDTSGVLLTRKGESWFIDAPQVEFSVQGGYTEPASGAQ